MSQRSKKQLQIEDLMLHFFGVPEEKQREQRRKWREGLSDGERRITQLTEGALGAKQHAD